MRRERVATIVLLVVATVAAACSATVEGDPQADGGSRTAADAGPIGTPASDSTPDAEPVDDRSPSGPGTVAPGLPAAASGDGAEAPLGPATGPEADTDGADGGPADPSTDDGDRNDPGTGTGSADPSIDGERDAPVAGEERGAPRPPAAGGGAGPPAAGDGGHPVAGGGGSGAPPTTSTTATTGSTSGGSAPGPSYFATTGPTRSLPSGATCAERVRAASTGVERIAENASRNGTTRSVTVVVDGADASWNDDWAARVTGAFTGTTDDILRWGACKWGFDEDITRARAVAESSWRMSTEGDRTSDRDDCDSIGRPTPCHRSFGLLQVKSTVHDGTYPASVESTAFGVDYALAWLRACYDGAMPWLGQAYGPGDEWGCVGAWFSGQWNDAGAQGYVATVRGHLAGRDWERY